MSTSTELDIIRGIIKKGAISEAYKESQMYMAGSQYGGEEDNKD